MGEDVAAWQVITAVVLFLVTYSIIITEKINRAVIALAGALLMVILGIVDFEATYGHHIEWKTIFLLIGMMILVGISNKTGMFQFAAVKAAQLAKGDPIRILLMLSALTALASAFLDNVTTVLLVVPVTFSITRILQVNPMPFLIAEILAANIGGTATLIGDPPNIMIGSANEHLTFNMFLVNLGPAVIIIMAVTMWLLKRIYGKQMSVSEEQKAELMSLSAADYITDSRLMKKSLIVLALTILGFVLHSVIHMEAAVVALAGATTLMLIGVKEHELEEVFHSIEWTTIFFFVGLFVLVGGLIDVGIIHSLASKAVDITGGNIAFASMLVLWVSGIASATIDNIPFVATMIPLVDNMGLQMGITDANELNPVWWSLALGACLGGNGTLIGASANVIVAGLAAREGKELSYMQFLKIGAPLTLVALLISTVYVYFVYL
jgi:Na+/H+ antiporter NhaD/arsenite permease-like protein